MLKRTTNALLICCGLHICGGLTLTSAHADTLLHQERSVYSTILVKQRGSIVCLQFSVRREQRNQSCRDERHPKRMQFAYAKMIMAALLYLEAPQRVLVIGLGGGTIPTALKELYPTLHIDAVEIDPAVVRVAEQFFDFQPDTTATVFHEDARVFVRRAALRHRNAGTAAQGYDLIVLDAFNGEYIPEHLMTREFLQDVHTLLADGGIVAANTFSISRLYDAESNTYLDTFGTLANFKLTESANRVIFATKGAHHWLAGADHDTYRKHLIERAKALRNVLHPYDIGITRLARILGRKQTTQPDWDLAAPVLTDQYAPANLLSQPQ